MSPCGDAPVSQAVKAVRRRKGSQQRQTGPLPFKASDRRSDQVAQRFTLKRCWGPAAATCRACGMRLYDAGLRVSELVVIEVTRIEPGNEEGSGLLHLPRSKAGQMGREPCLVVARQHVARWRLACRQWNP